MKNMKKVLAIVLSLALVCVISIAGTLAYLQSQTEAVTNTFIAGSLFTGDGGAGIVLNESLAVDGEEAGTYTLNTATKVMSNSYEIVPGVNVPKDPKVTVTKLDVNAYLFIEVVDGTPDTITWTVDSAWTLLEGVTGANGGAVYYIANELTPATTTAGQVFNIVDNEIINISGDHDPAATNSTINFYAYICQANSFANQAAAWTACFAGA